MVVTCPACNKGEQAASACARCGCDLSALHAVLEAAAASLADARAACECCDWGQALTCAERAWQLRHTPEAARLAFLAAAALGQTPCALRWHRLARGVNRGETPRAVA
jgi:hypothetical protein